MATGTTESEIGKRYVQSTCDKSKLSNGPRNTADSVTVCTSTIGASPGSPVCMFHVKGKCRFGERCRNAHLDGCTTPPTPRKEHRPAQRKSKNDESKSVEKLPPMKTAEDVISRLKWDSDLNEDNFVVGYLDRFLGIIEKPFNAFTWEDLSSLDNSVLAVPQHRIQYFKYKGFKVWDKNERLDIVFGSLGYKRNIREFMNLVDRKIAKNQAASCVDIPQELEASCSIRERSKPSHFVCLRITNPDIIKHAQAIMVSIVDQQPEYIGYIKTDKILHVTLTLLHLSGTLDTTNAITAFSEACEFLRENQVDLPVEGLDNFYNHILFARVSVQRNFRKFLHHLDECFINANVATLLNPKDIVPHVTLLKAKPNLKDKYSVDPALYEAARYTFFGVQMVENLELCTIGEKTDDGFYRTIANFSL